MSTVVVGMSGGVDSSVTAALLKEQGHKVIGLFMKNWEELDENGVCQSSKEYADVIKVCEVLDIPYYSVEFIEEYRENVFKHFVEEYKQGFTPNPDILCNREIKFKYFYDKAMELGADFLATGHYCQKELIGENYNLVKGHDTNKDQSYFLYTIKDHILQNVLFPIGNLDKSEVRSIAEKYNLVTHNKKDSTGICFIGERNFKKFLSQYIPPVAGKFVNLAGEVVGTHNGAAYYTQGQRKGLGLGGAGEPWFVIDKNTIDNIVTVERGEFHPALFCDELWANEISWVVESSQITYPLNCRAKIRYRQKDQECVMNLDEDGRLYVVFKHPQRAVAKRQSIVFYNDQICLGGGMIDEVGESYFSRGKLPKIVTV